MTQRHNFAHPHPPPKQETFRTVHEVLEETARVLSASSAGLGKLAVDPLVGARDSMMLAMLSQTHAVAASCLERIVHSAPRHGEDIWLQYAPIFGVRHQLAERIAASGSGQVAYEFVSEVDHMLETALRNLAEQSPASSELLHQTETLVLQLQRSSRIVVESAMDI